jgi:hypothetical protein
MFQRTESMISPVFGCVGVYTPKINKPFFGVCSVTKNRIQFHKNGSSAKNP